MKYRIHSMHGIRIQKFDAPKTYSHQDRSANNCFRFILHFVSYPAFTVTPEIPPVT